MLAVWKEIILLIARLSEVGSRRQAHRYVCTAYLEIDGVLTKCPGSNSKNSFSSTGLRARCLNAQRGCAGLTACPLASTARIKTLHWKYIVQLICDYLATQSAEYRVAFAQTVHLCKACNQSLKRKYNAHCTGDWRHGFATSPF